MSSYVLLLKPGWDGVCIDAMLDVSAAVVGVSFKDWIAAAKVCDRIDGTARHELLRAVPMMNLRSRLDGGCEGPFLLHCDEVEFTRDELEKFLRDNPVVLHNLREKGRI
jgi:hypothetical protein